MVRTRSDGRNGWRFRVNVKKDTDGKSVSHSETRNEVAKQHQLFIYNVIKAHFNKRKREGR